MTQNKCGKARPFKFYPVTKLHFLNTHQICMYIKKLHQIIRNQQICLNKLKKKARKPGKGKDEKCEEVAPKVNEDEDRDQKVSNFLDDIKSAATEGFIQQMGMIYEPTSGMYYHPTTGYYYNAQYNLYYDGNTGTYMTYNEDSFAYEFYCKADIPVAADTKTEKTVDKAKHSSEHRERDQKRERKRDASDYESLDEFGREKRRDRRRRGSRSRSSSLERHRRKRYRRRSSSENDDRRRKRRSPRKRSKRRDRNRRGSGRKSKSPSEEGEISARSSSHSDSGDERPRTDENVVEFRHPRKDIAAKYPPSLRLIIQETDLNQDKLKVGSLFIIPYTGGSLGREGTHDIIIPDVNISKSHLKFSYNKDKDRYECSDTGSRNGTLLNGNRMSEAGVKSKCLNLPHDSVIELNKTKILCHIHEGHTTCDKCEPGIVQKVRETNVVTPAMEVLSHKAALKQLQKRYGLENEKYVEDPKDKPSSSSSSYKDRADTRRKTVGSSHHTEKTVVASVDTSIASDNKGFKLLSKLGWSEGQKLGKSDTGLLEPIPIVSNDGTKGLGCSQPIIGPVAPKNKRKAAILAKTQQRFAESGNNATDGVIDSD